MIVLEGVAARRAPMTLADLNVSWGPGIHAVLGAPNDGGPLLLYLLAGFARPRRGSVRVVDGNPVYTRVRSQIALVPLYPVLPDALRVGEIVALARRLRSDPRASALESLSVLGLEALAPRLARTLSHDERRAVLLAQALGSPRVRVLLVEEPGVRVESRAAHRLGAALRDFARGDRVVIVATSSSRDAEALADDVWQLRTGCLRGPFPPATSTTMESSSSNGATLRVRVSDPRALTGALSRESTVEGVAYDDLGVRVHGPNALALAEAVGRAIVATQVAVMELAAEPDDDFPSIARRQADPIAAQRARGEAT